MSKGMKLSNDTCSMCGGDGEVLDGIKGGVVFMKSCPVCHGSGVKPIIGKSRQNSAHSDEDIGHTEYKSPDSFDGLNTF